MRMATTKGSDVTIYYENPLLKKEGVNNWILYWVVIRDKWVQLFEADDPGSTYAPGRKNKHLVKTLELTPTTQCTIVKRKKRRFPFSINNGFGVYYMKCDTELERYHWIFSLLTSALGKPKCPLPKNIPDSMVENEAFKRAPKKENASEKANRPSSDYHSRRRQKYADRNEKRHLRKEAKRNRKLAEEHYIKHGVVLPSTTRSHSGGELYRSTKMIPGENTTNVGTRNDNTKTLLKETNSNTNRGEKPKQIGSRNVNESIVDLRKTDMATSAARVVKVDVLIHPSDDGTITNVSENLGFEASDYDDDDDDEDDEDDDEDVNGYNRIKVISCNNDILPNLVMTQTSDVDSDTDSTADTSIHSQHSLFPNFGSCNDVSTFPPDILDSNDIKQIQISQRLAIPIPDSKNPAISSPRLVPRVLSAGTGRLEKEQRMIERPTSPFEVPETPRPLSGSSVRPRTQFSRFMATER